MRKFFKAFATLATVTPFIMHQRNRLADDEPQQYEDLTPEIQTHINKIFLTSDISEHSDLKIFAFDADTLGKQVATHLDTTLGRHITSRFNDGQINIQVLDVVRGHPVYIIKSFDSKDINQGIMQLIFAVSCMKKAGAQSVTAILPFFPYSTSSTPFSNIEIEQRITIKTNFAGDIVRMLQNVGCDQIITLNSVMLNPKGLANQSTFLSIDAPQIAVPYLIRTKLQNPVLVGTEANKVYIRNIYRLGQSFSLFGYNCNYGFFSDMQYIGEPVNNRDVVLYNNLVRTGNSMKKRVKQLKRMGARYIYCYGFHGLCSNDLFEELVDSLPIQQLIMTNTIFQAAENKKIRTISVAKLLAEIITIIHDQKSLSEYRSERQILKYAYLEKIKTLNSRNTSNIMEQL